MKSLFDEESYKEVLGRIHLLTENSKPLWGKMSVGQMSWHCQFPLKIAIKNKLYDKRPNFLAKLFFKKAMYNDKPWRKGLPTARLAKAVEEKDFNLELDHLKKLVEEFHHLKDREVWNPHPMFGHFTPDQWGKMQYKHLDHHLRQFDV